MKLTPVAAAICLLPAFNSPAQEKPQTAPTEKPAASAPAAAPAPTASAPAPSAFKTAEERRAYALALYLTNTIKRMEDGLHKPDIAQIEAGMKALLNGQITPDYAQGAGLGTILKRDDMEVDQAAMFAALRELMDGATPKMSNEEFRMEMTAVSDETGKKRKAKLDEEAEKNMAESKAFLEKNKSAEGVKTTESGLQYRVVSENKDGKKPNQDSMVKVKFTGKLLNGREFDAATLAGPRVLPLNLHPGWTEALQLMPVGSKFLFWMPPNLAFGQAGRLPSIRPNSVLAYEIELLEILPPGGPTSAVTPPISIPGNVGPRSPANPNKQPITATTPPISVEIPPKGDAKDGKTPPAPKSESPTPQPEKPSK